MRVAAEMACWGRDDEQADTQRPPPDRFVLAKQCSCGVRYDEIGWRELDYVGPFIGPDGETRVMRNCAFCRSSISRALEDEVSP